MDWLYSFEDNFTFIDCVLMQLPVRQAQYDTIDPESRDRHLFP